MNGSVISNVHQPDWWLAAGAAQRLVPVPRGRWIQITAGLAWLTRSGAGAEREADVWLREGERHWLPAGSEWVIEGRGAASFVLLEAAPSPASWHAWRARRASLGAPTAAWPPDRPSPRSAACSSSS